MKTYRALLGSVPMMQHSLARSVQWRDTHSIGNPAIDAQDRVIFNLLGEIDESWARGAGVVQLRNLADKASRVLEAHCRCEERMLAEIGYPGLARHAAEHHEMLGDLELIREYLNGRDGVRSGYAGLRLSNFMLAVTMGHVIDMDHDYCRYFDQETAKISTGCA